MKNIQRIVLNDGSREEHLPDFSEDFPYIATRAELSRYAEPVVPWHWHRCVELFYVESGTLEYTTPGGRWCFPSGSGGMVNSNVLHSSAFRPTTETIQLLHILDPVFLGGEPGSRMESRYVLPLTTSGIELIPLYPENPKQAKILEKIHGAFLISEEEWGYEFRLREALSQIWMELLDQVNPILAHGKIRRTGDGQIKLLMSYIQEHLSEPISVDELAQAAHISRRACFRLFQQTLHTTPLAYLQSCRLQKARRLLVKTGESITEIAGVCGFGSVSHFGALFREKHGCSPAEYRKRMARSE